MLRSCRYCRRFTNRNKRCRLHKKTIDHLFIASSCKDYKEHDPHAKQSIQNYYRNKNNKAHGKKRKYNKTSRKSFKMERICPTCTHYGEISKSCFKHREKIKNCPKASKCKYYKAISRKYYNRNLHM